MPLEITKTDVKKKTPHLALTHNELQGGAASGRNVSLLMKSDVALTEEIEKALMSLGISIDKSMFASSIRDALQTAVSESYKEDEDDWLYVEDYDDSIVVFCSEDGLFSTTYSLVDGKVTLGDLAKPMTRMVSYVAATGEMLLSDDAEDKLEQGVYSLVAKALKSEQTQAHLVQMFKSLELKKSNTKDIPLKEEIEKAVAAVETILKAQIDAQTQALEKASARIKELEQAAVVKARKEVLASVEADTTKLDALVKSLESLSDEAFAVVAGTMVEKSKAVEESDLFKQHSVHMKQEEPEEGSFDAMMKAKYAAK